MSYIKQTLPTTYAGNHDDYLSRIATEFGVQMDLKCAWLVSDKVVPFAFRLLYFSIILKH